MKDLFNKNDRYLNTSKIIFIVFIVLALLISVIGGIVLSAIELVVVGVPLLIVGVLFTFITYIFGRLFFSYLVDVKAIRNKLYDCDNDELYSFCGIEDTVGGEEDDEDNSQDSSSLATKLTELKSAYDCGALTKEEYEEQKRRIIND